jgi:hypothetical protein
LRFTKLNLNGNYNKRGYKAQKKKKSKKEEAVETVVIDEKTITTSQVFSLMKNIKTEDFVAKIKKVIIGLVAAAAIVTLG